MKGTIMETYIPAHPLAAHYNPVEYSKRIDGLYNKWEKLHPCKLTRDTLSDRWFLSDTAQHTAFVWVITEVVDSLPKE